MRILKTIFGCIFDPVKKLISHINIDKITKFFSKRSFVVYILAAALTALLVLSIYVWFK